MSANVAYVKYKSCDKCDGSGKQIDQRSLAKDMRELRNESGFSLRYVAYAMGISAPYLSDLERGNRPWNDEVMESFKKVVAKRK